MHRSNRFPLLNNAVPPIIFDESFLGLSARRTSAYPPVAMPSTNGELLEYDPSTQMQEEPEEQDDDIGQAATGTVLKVKYLDEILQPFQTQWTVKPTPTSGRQSSSKDSPGVGKYNAYVFNVIRKFNPAGDPARQVYSVTTSLEIHSESLRNVGIEVIGDVPGISWTAKPLRLDPQILLGWLSELQAYAQKLAPQLESVLPDSPLAITHTHLEHLLTYLTTTHASSLTTLESLLAHQEITFDLLWALFVPRKTILYVLCPVTGEPRAVRLMHAERCQVHPDKGTVSAAYDPTGLSVSSSSGENSHLLRLVVEYVEVDIDAGERLDLGRGEAQPRTPTRFGYAGLGTVLDILSFKGAKKITKLGAFPIQYYAGPGGPEGIKQRLVQRGRKWVKIAGGVSHLAYKGMGFFWSTQVNQHMKFSIDSRVMIDRKTFEDIVSNYGKLPVVTKTLSGEEIDRHARRASLFVESDQDTVRPSQPSQALTDDELLLTSPIVYGFSLGDKRWLEMAVDRVQPFQWNDEAYANLVIPQEQKSMLSTLVESHDTASASKFDDFVEGKGLGLVINLFGHPGTGKSLTAEAMSEHVRKPLYVVGAADLGTTADSLDKNLTTVLKVSAVWGAVVLIDEADVFLEERSLQYLERNAMVAVFLRQLEYFKGILFLTTNRVRVFDEAFQSRIHISLRYFDLNSDARQKIWAAFLKRANPDLPHAGLSKEELRELGEQKINGRQIKNVVKTANALAVGRQEQIGYRHLKQVLNMMEQFDASHGMYQ